MLSKPLTLAAGLLALPAACAFMIPPEVNNSDVQIASTIASIGSQMPETQVVDVECPGCSVRFTSHFCTSRQIKIDRPSYLKLTFSIDHQPDQDRLLLNGLELYPAIDAPPSGLTAPPVIWRGPGEEGGEMPSETSDTPQPQGLGFVTSKKYTEEGCLKMVEVDVQFIQVGSMLIDSIPSVKLMLIKDCEGRLLMSQIKKGEPNRFAKLFGSSARKEYASAISKWLAIAREKVKGLKGFGGHCNKTGAKGAVPAEAVYPPGANWRATDEKHRWGKLLKHMASHILLPVLIGIVAGVSASFIGMVVGTVVVSVWRFFFRRNSTSHARRRRHSLHKAARQEQTVYSDEKDVLILYQDEPPAYEDEKRSVETAKM